MVAIRPTSRSAADVRMRPEGDGVDPNPVGATSVAIFCLYVVGAALPRRRAWADASQGSWCVPPCFAQRH